MERSEERSSFDVISFALAMSRGAGLSQARVSSSCAKPFLSVPLVQPAKERRFVLSPADLGCSLHHRLVVVPHHDIRIRLQISPIHLVSICTLLPQSPTIQPSPAPTFFVNQLPPNLQEE